MGDGGEEQTPERRIRHARETAAVLKRLFGDPTYENMAAFHELHARHLRELGDEETAARADERATQARRRAAHDSSSPSTAMVDPDAPRGSVERPGADGPIRVQYAQAVSQRADAALQRAVEGSQRAEAYAARDKSARERSGAARRRLLATGARDRASALRSPLGERGAAADERDRLADERERMADDRERIADERDDRADRRDKIADRRDRVADNREKASE